jgi:hypothetical protein
VSTPNRFAVRDAGKATFYNLQTGKAIVTLDSLKTSGIESSAEQTFARGGFGNSKLVGFSHNKEAKLNLTDALFDKHALAMLTGNALVESAKVIDYYEVKTITSNKLTLSKTPTGVITTVYKLNSDNTNGDEFTLGTPGTNAKEFSVSGKDLTFHTTVSNGTQFRVYYKVTTAADAKTVRVSSDTFGGIFKIVVNVLVRDSKDGLDYAAQIIVPRGQFLDNFSMDLSVDGDPASLALPIDCLRDPNTNSLWEMVIFSDADIL